MTCDLEFLKQALPYGITGYAFDTRAVEPGQVFIALPGDRVDGHDFLLDAVRKGAGGLIIEVAKQDRLATIPDDLLENIFHL